jgi:tetratricopeptide (TPR) repeat protein
MGKYIGASLADGSKPAVSIGSAIAVLFSGLGFIAGFLFASVYLTVVLEDTAQVLSVVDVATEKLSATDKSALLAVTDQMNTAEKQAIPAGAAPKTLADKTLAAQNLAQASSAAEKLKDVAVDPSASQDALELLGNAKMNLGIFEEAAQAFSAAIKKDGSRYRLYQSLATALFRLKRVPEAVETMERARPLVVSEAAGHVLRFYEILTFYCLYLPAPASYEKCILYAKEFLSRGTDPYGGIWINYACAFGLKAAAKRAAEPNANIDAEAAEARIAVDQALRLAQNWRARIEQLMTQANADNDLAVFRNHPAFRDFQAN